MADLARLPALDGVAQSGRSGRADGEPGVRLSTLDGEGLVALAPRRGQHNDLAARLRSTFGVSLPDPGRAIVGRAGVAVLWGGLGQYLVLLPAGGLHAAARLAEAIGQPGLGEDPRFSDNSRRTESHALLKAQIEAWSGTRGVAEVVAALQRHDVPCSPILTVSEAVESPQARARALLRTVDGPDGRRLTTMTQPVRFSGMPASSALPPPALGADGRDVLAKLLGMDAEEIAALARDGVLHGEATKGRT